MATPSQVQSNASMSTRTRLNRSRYAGLTCSAALARILAMACRSAYVCDRDCEAAKVCGGVLGVKFPLWPVRLSCIREAYPGTMRLICGPYCERMVVSLMA